MKELAQLPTPTIATRTLASSRTCAPLLSLISSLVPPEGMALSGKGHPAPVLVTDLRDLRPVLAAVRRRCRVHAVEFVANVPDALKDGEDRQRGDDVDRR